MSEKENTEQAGTGGEKYGGVNQGATGDAPEGDEKPLENEPPADGSESHEGPNQGASGDAPSGGDRAA